MRGYVLVDKPAGMTSFDVVRHVRRNLSIKRVGHAGTLDPFATGLLVVLVGTTTRLMPWVVGHDKRYRLEVAFGATSDSDDVDGELTPTGQPLPTAEQLQGAVAKLAATSEQTPPRVSALHIDGERAYRRARRNEEFEIAPRAVTWHAMELRAYDGALATLYVTASAGTYMRSLARDLGELCGCGAYASALRRIRSGRLDVADAVALEDVGLQHVRPSVELMADRPIVELAGETMRRFAHGQIIESDVAAAVGDGVGVLSPDGQLIGIATKVDEGSLRATAVLEREVALGV